MGSDRPLRCERCLGTGYVGRWRTRRHDRRWSIENCPSCGGRGERVYTRLSADQRRTLGDGS